MEKNKHTERKECQICCLKFTKSISRMPIACSSCEAVHCRNCVSTYILINPTSPNCMNCNTPYSKKKLKNEILRKRGEFKQYELKNADYIIAEDKKNLDPYISHIAKRNLAKTYKSEEKEAWNEYLQSQVTMERSRDEFFEFERKLRSELRTRLNVERMKHTTLVQDMRMKKKRFENLKELGKDAALNFVHPGFDESGSMKKLEGTSCPRELCNGVLLKDPDSKGCVQHKCSICLHFVCVRCDRCFSPGKQSEEKRMNHVCIESEVETKKLLMNTTKPCPTCSIRVSKTEGCDHMWCTQCRTTFSWKTGEKLANTHSNPHKSAYNRQIKKRGRNKLSNYEKKIETELKEQKSTNNDDPDGVLLPDHLLATRAMLGIRDVSRITMLFLQDGNLNSLRAGSDIGSPVHLFLLSFMDELVKLRNAITDNEEFEFLSNMRNIQNRPMSGMPPAFVCEGGRFRTPLCMTSSIRMMRRRKSKPLECLDKARLKYLELKDEKKTLEERKTEGAGVAAIDARINKIKLQYVNCLQLQRLYQVHNEKIIKSLTELLTMCKRAFNKLIDYYFQNRQGILSGDAKFWEIVSMKDAHVGEIEKLRKAHNECCHENMKEMQAALGTTTLKSKHTQPLISRWSLCSWRYHSPGTRGHLSSTFDTEEKSFYKNSLEPYI